MVLVHGANSNRFGDIDCGFYFVDTLEEARNRVRLEAMEMFTVGNEVSPEIVEAVEEGLQNNQVIIGTDISGADYDYIWKIEENPLDNFLKK